MKLRQQIIKQLMLEYQKNPTSVLFAKILKRTDKLLLHIVHNLLSTKPHLQEIDIEELYHEAINGLGKAALTIKEKDQDRYVPARIVAYVKAEIRSAYPYHPKEIPLKNKDIKNLNCSSKTEMLGDLIDLEKLLLKLTYEEQDLLSKRFFLCLSYKKLGLLFHVTPGAMWQRVQLILTKLKEGFK